MTLESCGNTLNEFQESEANNIYRKRQTQIQAWTLNEFQAQWLICVEVRIMMLDTWPNHSRTGVERTNLSF